MPFLVGMPRGADVRVSGALILAALVACGRPAASRAPAIADAPASERPEPAVDEPALASDIAGHTVDAEVASVAAEPRAARSADRRVFVEPPSVSQDRMDVWGGESATEFGGGGLGCPLSSRVPPPPSYERGGRRSLVRLRSIAAVGPLIGADARRILDARATGIRACHAAAMEADPGLAGDLRLHLEIDEHGHVSEAEAVAPALGGVAACVLEVARAWRFPPAERGSQITASFALGTEVAPREAPRGPSCRR